MPRRGARTATAAALCAALALFRPAMAQEAEAPGADREITSLRQDLYAVRDGSRYTVFYVTADGIVVADPLSAATARWLAEELTRRFPGIDVRYVVHTHHHYDRAEGASLFASGAEVVGHDRFNLELTRARRMLPPALAALDENRDGYLDRSEVGNDTGADLVALRDRNGDGRVSAEELYARVQSIETSYASRRTLTLGSRRVQLVHAGPAHAADMTVVHFPDEGVVFAVDPPQIETAPFDFGEMEPRHVMRWLDRILELDFDIVFTGSGRTVPRDELVELRRYLRTLTDLVGNGYAAGLALADLQQSDQFEPLAGSRHYEARAAQVSDIYARARLFAGEMWLAALMNYTRPASAYCRGFDVCSTGGGVQAGSAGVRLMLGRRVAFASELTWSEQAWSGRSRSDYDEEYVFRATRGTFLIGYGSYRNARLSYAVLGGASVTHGATSGLYRLRNVLLPVGGRHVIDARGWRFGVTGGGDIVVPVHGRLDVVVPVRVTWHPGSPPDSWPDRIGLSVGAGLAFRLFRVVQ